MPKSKTPKGNARTRRLARARALKTMRKQLEDRAWKVEGGPMLVASVWELAKKAGAADIAFERSLGGKACAFTDAANCRNQGRSGAELSLSAGGRDTGR